MIHGETLSLRTRGHSDLHDLTPELRRVVAESGVGEGLVNVFVIGSTGSVTTI